SLVGRLSGAPEVKLQSGFFIRHFLQRASLVRLLEIIHDTLVKTLSADVDFLFIYPMIQNIIQENLLRKLPNFFVFPVKEHSVSRKIIKNIRGIISDIA